MEDWAAGECSLRALPCSASRLLPPLPASALALPAAVRPLLHALLVVMLLMLLLLVAVSSLFLCVLGNMLLLLPLRLLAVLVVLVVLVLLVLLVLPALFVPLFVDVVLLVV